MIKRRNWLVALGLFCASLILVISCSRPTTNQSETTPNNSQNDPETIVIGYSSWPGWLPWEIAEKKGLFTKNSLNVKLQWFDDYANSLTALAAGQLDANCQTLNDTIAFASNAVDGEVAVLVNDNSNGNDQIIVTSEISSVEDLRGRKVAIQEGIIDEFLLALALEKYEVNRDEMTIIGLETGDGVAAFSQGFVDAVAAFPPYSSIALKRSGSKVLVSSADFPGAIPDLLVVTEKMAENKPEVVNGLIKTWFDVLQFMEENPAEAIAIMAQRAGASPEEYQKYKDGTKMFTIEDNIKAFSPGKTMEHMPFAAQKMADFMSKIGLITKVPPLKPLLNASFVYKYAKDVGLEVPVTVESEMVNSEETSDTANAKPDFNYSLEMESESTPETNSDSGDITNETAEDTQE